MNRIGGYIGSNPRDAALVGDALKEGSVSFEWTNGTTFYKFYMIPSSVFKTVFSGSGIANRWAEHGQIIVGIERIGCFNFGLMDGQEFSGPYVAEKLGLDPTAEEAQHIAKLFTLISIYLLPKRSISIE